MNSESNWRKSAEKELALARELEFREERERLEESLYLFLIHAWKYAGLDSAPFVPGWPIEAVAEHLQAVVDGDIKRLCINIPPRCLKSTLCSVALPAWTWAQPVNTATSGPGVQFLAASYAQQLVLRDSVKCRRLIESPWYQKYWGKRFKLTGDQNTKSRFANNKGGERLITSVDSAVTGEGASIILADDPNAANEAFSEASIRNTIDWWDGAMSTRLNDPKTGAYIVIQQRLAEDDLTGHILSKDVGEWTHLCYDDQTEVLTQRGWILFDHLTDADDVMGASPETLCGQWERPSSIIREDYVGEVISYQSMTADLVVTPDHRMIYGDENDMLGGEPSHWRVRAAQDLPENFYLPQTIKWTGSHEKILCGGRLWEPMAYAEFMGWYLSEGCANEKSRAVRLVQKDGGKGVEELERVLSNVPFHVSKHRNSDTMLCWQIKDRFLSKELAALGDSLNKRAPTAIKELAPQYLRQFLISYARGDGHFAVKNSLKTTIGTASAKMADDLQECAVKSGWASSLSVVDRAGGDLFPNGYLRKDSRIYKLYIRASKVVGRDRKVGSRIRKPGTSRRPYDGKVYCVSVPSSGVVVRRNGRVSISGNCLPMHYEPERSFVTSIGWKDPRTEPGELLWPERFGVPEVKALEVSLGKFKAAGQLEQRPEPPGGGIIKREWWQTWEDDKYPRLDYIMAYCDTAYTEKTINDPSAMTVWGVFSQDPVAMASRVVGANGSIGWNERSYSEMIPKVMLMHAWQDRLEFHELVEKIRLTATKWKCDNVLIENKASGISVAQELRRVYGHENFSVQLNDPKSQDKISRLYSVQHLFSEGLIYAPDRQWADMVITQVGQFPAGKHDDLVDTVSGALRHLRDIGLLTRSIEKIAEIEASKVYTGKPPAPLYPC